MLEVFDSIQMTPTGYLAGLRKPDPADTAPCPSASFSASTSSR